MNYPGLEHQTPALFAPGTPERLSTHRYSWVKKEERDLNEQLIQAAWDNDLPLVKALVKQGGDINYQDTRKESCYLIATSEGYLELLAFCLKNGADFKVHDSYGGNGMIRAAERGHGKACAMLYAASDEVDHVNHLPYTALTEAVIFGDGCLRYAQTVLFLLAAGADPSFTVKGKTIIELAQDMGFDSLALSLARLAKFPKLQKTEAQAYLDACYALGDAGGAALTLRQFPLLAPDKKAAPKTQDAALIQQRELIETLVDFLGVEAP